MVTALDANTEKVLMFGKTVKAEKPFIIVDKTSGTPEVNELILEDVPRFQPLACPIDDTKELMGKPYSTFHDGR